MPGEVADPAVQGVYGNRRADVDCISQALEERWDAA
jgi:hypothetical protein